MTRPTLRCLCCGLPSVRLVLGTAPACAACAAGTCPRCADEED